MTPGLPRLPEPPHDPFSLLLNGRLGFAMLPPAPGMTPVAVDPECCALVLPTAAAALRGFSEPSGSLGGVRAPSNVAIGPDGSIYLLDRIDLQMRRFDPCTCKFERVPCFGGLGGGARELRNPGGIAIACGNLYVCDTGFETTPRENHRVSVFTLHGLAVRGHLTPPASERPWQPVSVAVDSLGRAWVGDATGRLHRFTPHGNWDRAWPIVPVARHLAIDCHDRIYVVSSADEIPQLRILDSQGHALPETPSRPEEVRKSFPCLPFRVDREGLLWLETACDPRTVVFDLDGRRREIPADRNAPIYEKAAVYRSDALDSRTAQCVWHRVMLLGALPLGTRLRVRAFCADQKFTGAELDSLANWQDCAVATEFDGGAAWDCLIRAQPGRYLWMEIAFEGNGLATPVIGAIVVEFPRISLRRFLPAVFGMEPVSADFTDRFLALFDAPLRSIERQVDKAARLFDPASAPAVASDPRQLDFLSWLATWVGVSVDRNWDVATRRRFLKRAGSLFDRRGTLQGLREQLLLLLGTAEHAPCPVEERACGRCTAAPRNCGPEPEPPRYTPPPLVLEHFQLRRWLRVGTGRLGAEAVVWGERIVGRTRLGAHGQLGVTRLDTSPDPLHDPFLVHANQFSVFVPARCRSSERERKALENLIRNEAPASARGSLHFVEPRFRIGVQSMLGFDAVVGAVPQGVTLGASPLGGATVLTSPPHKRGGPAVALGHEGRVGSTTLLA